MGFECVVKRLRMVLYKPDYDSNDCEWPNEKATTSILAIEVWLVRLHVGWAINRIPYCSSDGCVWLGVGYIVLAVGLKNRRRLILDDRQLSCMYKHANRSSMHDIDNACTFGIASEHARKRGVVTCNIIHAYSFSCDSFDCVLCKDLQFAIKRILHSKPDLRYNLQHSPAISNV